MVTLEARPLVNLIIGLVNMDLSLRQLDPNLTVSRELTEKLPTENLVDFCEKLRLTLAVDALGSVREAKTVGDLKRVVVLVRDVMAMGLNRRKFFEPETRYTEYFENPKLFGDAVFDAFPSATDDIAEAGTCLALERSTACVMHSMRAAEVALKALANSVGVGIQGDWGAYIREIYKALEKQVKAAGAQTDDHRFYAEAAAQIDNVKRAWRNPSMHVDKTYSQPRAEEILLATKSLLVHLATRVSE